MLGIRLDPATEKACETLARRTHRSKSDIAREAITKQVQRHDEAFFAQARRQSLRAAGRDDPGGWRFLAAIKDADSGWR